jgi:hypothetical protein
MTTATITVAEARAKREAGMALVAADSQWQDKAYATLVRYLKRHHEFFVDDFWAGTRLAYPSNARALGPVVLRASREGLMEKTGEHRPSVRSNLTAKPVWRSLIVDEAAA